MFTMYASQEHVAKKLMKRLSNVRSPRKATVPPSKKPRQDVEVSSDISTTDYDGDSSASTIILERSPVSPMGIPVLDPSPRASTPLQSQDSSDETCMCCIKHHFGWFNSHDIHWTFSSFRISQCLSKSICILLSNVLLLHQVTWTLINSYYFLRFITLTTC